MIALIAAAFAGRSLQPMLLPKVQNAASRPLSAFVVPDSCQGGSRHAVVQIGVDRIDVDGRRVVSLKGGRVGEQDRRGQLVTPLYDALLDLVTQSKEWGARCGTGFSGEILFAVDQRVPAATLRPALYTAGQAQYGRFSFLVEDDTTDNWVQVGASRRDGPPLNVTIGVNHDGLEVTAQGGVRRIELLCKSGCKGVDDYEWSALVSTLRPLTTADDRNAIYLPDESVPMAVLVRAFDEVRPLFPNIVLAGGIGGDPPPTTSQVVIDGQPKTVVLGKQVSVLVSELPRIGPAGGLLGAMTTQPREGLIGGLGGLIGAKGTQIGSGGLGSRAGRGLEGKSAPADHVDLAKVGGDPLILGALDRSLIDEVIRRHMNQLRYCYQRELKDHPGLEGKVVVKFVIAKDGSVSEAVTKASSLGSPPVEDCVNGRFRRMRFPEPRGGGIVLVSYPFLFAPK